MSDQELAGLDQAAMKDELERLKKLDVIEDAGDDLLVEEAMTLDTRLVRDWRFRDGRWKREFRAGDGSNAETFSPTTPLSVVKMLIVLGLVHRLAIAFFLWSAPLSFDWSPHLRLTCGPAGNRTTTGSLSASSRTTPYQLLHRDA